MTQFGYSLMCEFHHPNELLAQAARAEKAGFDFVTISDHIHPWLYSHDHSAYAWSVLGALATQTRQLELVSLVTCPTIRYHPAIVAQKAATIAAMSDGRFHLGLGTGEKLNEHVVGRGWPPADVRQEMLEEAIEIMRSLWSGGFYTHRGKHFSVEDARVHTLPEEPPPVHIAAGGKVSVELAARAADGLVATEPRADLTRRFDAATGGGRPKYGQLALSVDDNYSRARRLAHERFRFAAPGWKVMAELPNPVNFEAATTHVREEDVAELVSCGADVDQHVAAIQEWIDAGFDRVAVVQCADQERFFQTWENEIYPQIADTAKR